MKKKMLIACWNFIIICFLALSIFGCNNQNIRENRVETIPITIYRPAAIDIRAKNIEKIAVAPFFDKTPAGNSGTKASEMLAKALTDTLIYTVKGPTDTSSELLVNGVDVKPFMEKSQLQKIGEGLKVDAFFLGEIKERKIGEEVYNKVVTEKEGTGEYEFVQNPEGKLEYKEKVKKVDVEMECKARVGKITIQYILYDAKTGLPILDKTESLSEEVDAFCYRSNMNPEGMSAEEKDSMLNEVMQELSAKFVEQLTPPSKTELVIFERVADGDDFSNNLVKIGIDFAKIGEWKRAIDSFEQCQRLNRKASEAHYNLGIAYKGYGWFEKALTEFTEANRLAPKKMYNEAISSTKRLIEESKKQLE